MSAELEKLSENRKKEWQVFQSYLTAFVAGELYTNDERMERFEFNVDQMIQMEKLVRLHQWVETQDVVEDSAEISALLYYSSLWEYVPSFSGSIEDGPPEAAYWRRK